MAVNQLQVARLKELATDIRRRDLKMVHRARLGHIGGDLSATDILTTLYFSVLKVESADPGWAERDRFILSKGHCAGALWNTHRRVPARPLSFPGHCVMLIIGHGCRLGGQSRRSTA